MMNSKILIVYNSENNTFIFLYIYIFISSNTFKTIVIIKTTSSDLFALRFQGGTTIKVRLLL